MKVNARNLSQISGKHVVPVTDGETRFRFALSKGCSVNGVLPDQTAIPLRVFGPGYFEANISHDGFCALEICPLPKSRCFLEVESRRCTDYEDLDYTPSAVLPLADYEASLPLGEMLLRERHLQELQEETDDDPGDDMPFAEDLEEDSVGVFDPDFGFHVGETEGPERSPVFVDSDDERGERGSEDDADETPPVSDGPSEDESVEEDSGKSE